MKHEEFGWGFMIAFWVAGMIGSSIGVWLGVRTAMWMHGL